MRIYFLAKSRSARLQKCNRKLMKQQSQELADGRAEVDSFDVPVRIEYCTAALIEIGKHYSMKQAYLLWTSRQLF